MKKLRLLFALFAANICAVQGAWAQDTELTVSVKLLEAGSLGTEILAAPGVDHIKNVVNLTVSGPMNDDDWATLKLIDALKTLDLSKAETKRIPECQFDAGICPNLTTVKLPNTIESVGYGAFRSCGNLLNINWPTSANEIPQECFYDCRNLQPFTIPNGVTKIGDGAFMNCSNYKSTIPSTIKEIGGAAFSSDSYYVQSPGMEGIDVVIPEGAFVGYNAFSGTKVNSITFPSTYYRYDQGTIHNPTVTLTFKSPTVMLDGYNAPEGTLRVPQYLVNSYKLDQTWGRWAKVEGFTLASVTDVTTWPIQTNFTMSNNIRMDGTPNVELSSNIVLTVTGTNAQNFKNFSFWSNRWGDGWWPYLHFEPVQLLSTCDNVKIAGTMEYHIGAVKEEWHFMSLPFDFKVGDVTADGDTKFAIRTYNGSNRASKKETTGNWKSMGSSDVIKAGQGFIIQTNHDAWVTFKAQANDSRNYALSNKIFETALQVNNSSEAEHKGWNLVGNPWQTWYNIHKMNFTAPISVYENGTYNAYSVIDDDYALQPNQAFFVQCPNNVTKIGFPVDGRQLDDKIESQNAARSLAPAEKSRFLVDVQMATADGKKDKTRLVVNSAAQMGYELSCDASKFMTMDEGMPQIYSIDNDGTQYAINERPMGDGSLRLGIVTPAAGQYTLSTVRNDLSEVMLTDNQTGETVVLSAEGYTFTASQGTDESRFTLSFLSSEVTGISTVAQGADAANLRCYNLHGQRVDGGQHGLFIVNGKKMIVK